MPASRGLSFACAPNQSQRVALNIKGNDHRLIVAVAYMFGAVYIKFVGTHKEYDAIDATTVEIDQ